jgi:hypothetical protein
MEQATRNFDEMIASIKQAGVSIWPGDDGKLCVWGADLLTPEQLDFLRTNKTAVVAFLRRRNTDLLPPNEVCEAWRRRYAKTGSRKS